MQADYDNTAVIIPLHNCGSYLEKLLKGLGVFFPPEQIITVNDGSSDGTSRICREYNTELLDFSENRGKGAALKAGFNRALERNFIFAVTIDGDLQHDPAKIPDFINRQQETRANMIIGRRKFSPGVMPLHRILSNRITSGIVSLVTGVRIPDSQSGYRLYDLELFSAAVLRSDRYQFETEVILHYAGQGARFDSVDIATIYGGQQSHISHWRDIVNFVKVILDHKKGNK